VEVGPYKRGDSPVREGERTLVWKPKHLFPRRERGGGGGFTEVGEVGKRGSGRSDKTKERKKVPGVATGAWGRKKVASPKHWKKKKFFPVKYERENKTPPPYPYFERQHTGGNGGERSTKSEGQTQNPQSHSMQDRPEGLQRRRVE